MARPLLTAPPPAWLWYLALSVSVLPLFAGIGFVLFPTTAAVMVGWPVPTTSVHKSYFILLGAREVFLALTAIALWLLGEVRALGWVLVLVCIIPATDGWVALQNNAAWLQVMQHWGSLVLLAAIGYGLLRGRQ